MSNSPSLRPLYNFTGWVIKVIGAGFEGFEGRRGLDGISVIMEGASSGFSRGDMPRQARLDAPGTLHHVIVRGIEKRRIVDDKVDRDNFVLRIGQVAHETETVMRIKGSALENRI